MFQCRKVDLRERNAGAIKQWAQLLAVGATFGFAP
jgi:hypothetical protein